MTRWLEKNQDSFTGNALLFSIGVSILTGFIIATIFN